MFFENHLRAISASVIYIIQCNYYMPVRLFGILNKIYVLYNDVVDAMLCINIINSTLLFQKKKSIHKL